MSLSPFHRDISLFAYSQSTPVDAAFVRRAKELTSDDYPFQWNGLAVKVSSVVAQAWGVKENEWREAACGVQRAQVLALAAASLAGDYKRALMAFAEKH